MTLSFEVRSASAKVGAVEDSASSLLPRRVLGRASPLTRALAHVLGSLDGIDVATAATTPTVFASAFGEVSALTALLGQWRAGDDPISPLRFVGSVHNAASGAISIATNAQGFTTSIAAGNETLCASLLEAAGLLTTGAAEVLIALADEPPPELLCRTRPTCVMVSGALWLRRLADPGPRGNAGANTILTLEPNRAGRTAPPPSRQGLHSTVAENPVGEVIALVEALRAGVPQTLALDGGWLAHLSARPERAAQ